MFTGSERRSGHSFTIHSLLNSKEAEKLGECHTTKRETALQRPQRSSSPIPPTSSPLIAQSNGRSIGPLPSAKSSDHAISYNPYSAPTPRRFSSPAPSSISTPLGFVPTVECHPDRSTGIPVAGSEGPTQTSHVGDEKRRRQAGASARFRARRKEKEGEATAKITALQSQVLWHKKERQEILKALWALPGGRRYFPREKSPPALMETKKIIQRRVNMSGFVRIE